MKLPALALAALAAPLLAAEPPPAPSTRDLERINWMGDLSRKGLKESGGVMVNYLYDLDEIEKNHEAFANQGEVMASGAVRRMLRGERAIFGITPPSFAQG